MAYNPDAPWFADKRKDGAYSITAAHGEQVAIVTGAGNATLVRVAPKLQVACRALLECATVAEELLGTAGVACPAIATAVKLGRKILAESEGRPQGG